MSNCMSRRGLLKSGRSSPSLDEPVVHYPGTCTCSRKMHDGATPLVLPKGSARPEMALVPEWTTETFAYRQRLTTLHQPLENLRRAHVRRAHECFLCTR